MTPRLLLVLLVVLPAGLAGCSDLVSPHDAPATLRTAAADNHVDVPVLAVAETRQGQQGIAYTATIQVVPGSGIVYVATEPATETDTQASATTAALVAAREAGVQFDDYDYFVHFTSNADLVGGPSAGAAMALAIYVALWNDAHPSDTKALDPDVAMTGTIEEDGRVGQIGGAAAKAQAVTDSGHEVYVYPHGQTETVQRGFGWRARYSDVSLDSTCEQLKLECIEVATLTELIEVATYG
ncbi:MAG TPA: S16 family serine protease [Candidatus Thermoplasmatota archaeon]|nr:S16 family serine protease [Candidatus Thermoplasmatota archaeon]